MAFFKNIKALFTGDNKKSKKEYSYIKKNQDPNEIWEIVGELGDGAFGKVYKVSINMIKCRYDSQMAPLHMAYSI